MVIWSKEVFAKNLRRYMEENNINQKELAEIAGVSPPTVNDWLKANIYPRIDKIERIANHFNILKSDLIEDKAPLVANIIHTSIDIGLLIREKRLGQGLTQAQLSERLGVSVGTIANWERGNVSKIKRKTIWDLSDILKISPFSLLGFSDDFNETMARRRKQKELWQQHFGNIDFSDTEFTEIINYTQFVLSKRPTQNDK